MSRMSRRLSTNPIITALTSAQAFHERQRQALGRAIEALRAVEEPVRDASPQRPRTPAEGGARPRRRFSAAAKRRMSAGMRRFWKERKAKLALKVQKAAQRAKAAS